MITIETKIRDFLGDTILGDIAKLFGKISRTYFVERHVKKLPLNELKSSYQERYGISSRHFNSVRTQVDGLVQSHEKKTLLNKNEKLEQISATQKTIKKLDRDVKFFKSQLKAVQTHIDKVQLWRAEGGKGKKPRLAKKFQALQVRELKKNIEDKRFRRHQKQRRVSGLKEKLRKIEESNRPSICFGSKKLFCKQYSLDASGYKSHHEWKEDWISKRNAQSYWVGSHEESFRNQNAQYIPAKKTLTLRLPKCLEEKYKCTHYTLDNVEFPYGQEWLEDSILTPRSEQNGKKVYAPVSYRFVERDEEIYCQASFEPKVPELKSDKRLGAIGLDLNQDHIAMMETDRFGNPVFAQSYPFSMEELSSEQIEAVFGDHIADIVERTKQSGKILVCENLDFQKKKQALREQVKGMRIVLSSFAYNKFFTLLESRSRREGVGLKKVNPVFTSLIGFYKFHGFGIYTSHECAALSIARRGLGLSERAKIKVTPIQTASIEEAETKLPTFSHKENLAGHVWSFYSRNKVGLRKSLFEHSSQSGRKRRLVPNPRYPSGYAAGLRCDKTILRSLSP